MVFSCFAVYVHVLANNTRVEPYFESCMTPLGHSQHYTYKLVFNLALLVKPIKPYLFQQEMFASIVHNRGTF